jgi:hypothetical protein
MQIVDPVRLAERDPLVSKLVRMCVAQWFALLMQFVLLTITGDIVNAEEVSKAIQTIGKDVPKLWFQNVQTMVHVRRMKFAVYHKGKNPVYPLAPPLIVDLGVSVLQEIM